MSERLHIRIGIVGGKQVGKRSLAEEYMCKYFNGYKSNESNETNESNESNESNEKKPKEVDAQDEYRSTIVTNVGPIMVEITVIRDIKKNGVTDHDAFIIVSDVTDEKMHTMYTKWHNDLTYCLGHRVLIINCFNKTDVSSVPTYIFESSAPAFDISTKTTSGIYDMLTYILRRVTKKENLLICM